MIAAPLRTDYPLHMEPQHLKAENLEKRYHSRTVVNQVSVQVKAGEIVGLLGPNGAGKTTCFYMIVGSVQADRGKIHLGETDITHKPMHARARLGISYLPQEPSVFRKLTVRQNILAILQLRKDFNRKQKKEKLEKLMAEFHIEHLHNVLGASLSGGERRRVEIARSLAMDPKYILLDEPFAGIDPISIIEIKNIIQHLAQSNIGILITDHNVRETLTICERAYIVSEGQIIAMGKPQEILENQQVKSVYLGEDFRL